MCTKGSTLSRSKIITEETILALGRLLLCLQYFLWLIKKLHIHWVPASQRFLSTHFRGIKDTLNKIFKVGPSVSSVWSKYYVRLQSLHVGNTICHLKGKGRFGFRTQLKLYGLNVLLHSVRSQEASVNTSALFSTSAGTAQVIQVLPVLINNKASFKARILLL